jgi:hypothetical protein
MVIKVNPGAFGINARSGIYIAIQGDRKSRRKFAKIFPRKRRVFQVND